VQAIGGVPGVAEDPAPAIVAIGFDGPATKLEARYWVNERASNVDTVRTGVVAAIRQALAQPRNEEAIGRAGEEPAG
jgi:hypothetical protein